MWPFSSKKKAAEREQAMRNAKAVEKQKYAVEKAPKALPKNMVPGMYVSGQGVYLGQWNAFDRDGKSLGKIYNVFAAKHDLRNNAGKKVHVNYGHL